MPGFMCGKGTNLIMAVVYVDDAMFLGKNKNLLIRRKLSSWTNENAMTWVRSRSSYACMSEDKVLI
jgi:hypothetical protein